MADTHVETSSDLNQDSLDGAQASVSEVGSAEEFTEKDNTNDTPSEENTGDVPDQNGHESREAEDAKENGDSAQDANGAAEEPEHHVNGKSGEAEADSTEVDGVVAEKRKSIAEVETPLSLSPKKARIEGTEEVTAVTEAVEAPTNGDSVEAVA